MCQSVTGVDTVGYFGITDSSLGIYDPNKNFLFRPVRRILNIFICAPNISRICMGLEQHEGE